MFKEVTFHVTNHEGSVVLSCATTLDFCLIQPCSNLDSIPYSASLITSKADDSRKKKSQKNMLVSKPMKNVCSSKEQSSKLLPAQGYSVNQCVIQEKKKKQASRSAKPMFFSMEDDKNCQSNNCVNIRSVTERRYMQLVKPAILQSAHKKKNQMKGNLFVMTRTVNLPSLPNLFCILTRTVKIPSVFTCSQWSQQWSQVIYGQWPSKVICSYQNQPWNKLITRSIIRMTQTVNPPRNIVMKSIQWDQCAMTRTVNLPNICIITRNVKRNLKGHNLLIWGWYQRLLACRLGHSLS